MTILLGFAAVNTGNNLLFLVVSGLLAFMSVTGYVGMVNLQRLSVALVPPAEVYAGQPAAFMVRLTNGKRWFPSFLLTLSCYDGHVICAHLPPGMSVELPLEVSFAERGRARISAVRVSSPFPVNFFVRSWRLPLNIELVVYPRLVACSGQGEGERGAHQSEGYREQRGSAGEVERIVEYTGRESLRQIHWKLSARSEEFKVKEYRAAAVEPLVIDLDDLFGSLEVRISCAAWMVHHWTPDRPVGLRLGGQMIAPLAGRRHMQQMLAALALYGNDG